MTTSTSAPEEAPSRVGTAERLAFVLRTPAVGPLLALVVAILVFSLTTETFMSSGNMSLLIQQTIVIGTLAIGQTLIILTAGIDLAAGAIAVMGTIVMAQHVLNGGNAITALLLGLVVTAGLGLVSGVLVSLVRLPPFIVTLGMLTVVFALTRLLSGSASIPVTDPLLRWWGQGFEVLGAFVTRGSVLLLAMFGLFWFLLAKTSWGTHVYAVGNAPESARLSGVKTTRLLLSVYVVAGVVYAVAAWQALGRIPNADPNAYQNANLDSITAVVIGGTSLFGGRGSVLGTLLGALIVSVLRSGLTQAGIDNLWQDVATGILVIVAVALDQLSRRAAR